MNKQIDQLYENDVDITVDTKTQSSTSNIFMTKSDCEKQLILSKYEVMQTIPSIAVFKKDEHASELCKELRWRIFKFPERENEIVEISYKLPNEPRMFMNKYGKWVNRDIGDEYNQFLVKEYYVYENVDY